MKEGKKMKKSISLGVATVFVGILGFFPISPAQAQVACSANAGTSTTAASVLKVNQESHYQASDIILGPITEIELTGSSVSISKAGTYRFTGKITDGKISVETSDKTNVQIILAGVEIKNSSGSAIEVLDAEEVIIFLEAGSKNILSDGEKYDSKLEPNATIFSKASLTIAGTGSLSITGVYNDGINSKDGLVITEGNLTITAKDDAIRGKDFVIVTGGTLILSASGGDGIKSDDEKTVTAGYVSVSGGNISITAKDDGIQGNTDVLITKGTIKISSGDDGINATCDAVFSGGTATISSGDDGFHSDGLLILAGGALSITKSYEALEAGDIAIKGGTHAVKSSDDGINIVAAEASSAADADAFLPKTTVNLTISGGKTVVTSDGDGIDANGNVKITGGSTTIFGPTANNNAALDVDGNFTISKGTLIGIGSSGMAMAPATTSAQASLKFDINTVAAANSKIEIINSSGKVIFSTTSPKNFSSVVFSSASVKKGETYSLKVARSVLSKGVAGSYSAGGMHGGPGGGPGGGGMKPRP